MAIFGEQSTLARMIVYVLFRWYIVRDRNMYIYHLGYPGAATNQEH